MLSANNKYWTGIIVLNKAFETVNGRCAMNDKTRAKIRFKIKRRNLDYIHIFCSDR